MSWTNSQIADVFDHLADLLEFQGANPFRVRGYRNGARAIRDLSTAVTAVVADDWKKLIDVEGIGKGVAEKCATLIREGSLPQLEALQAEIPESVLAIVRIPGLGPKRAAEIYRELGIATLDELQEACQAHRIRELKGFGAKTEQSILEGMEIAQAAAERIYWASADEIATQLREHLGELAGIEQLEVAGSYRRGKETVGDLDLLVVSSDHDAVMDHFGAFPEVASVLARGDTKMSVRLTSGLQVDLRVVPAESFGAALQYFTGSKEHNVVIRGMARARGLKVNEYGVFRVRGRQETYVAGASEAEVYAALDLPCFPPELREARWEFAWAERGALPELVELKQLRGDLHMHTTATDGRASLEEMVAAAQRRGLQYIAITDHSQRVSMAAGLDPKRLRAQWKAIDRINQELDKFHVLKGIECDILEAGGMDLPDDVLAEADWVLASIHYGQQQPREQITERLLGALENPHVDCIAHPTGRMLNRRAAYDVDMDAVLQAAAARGKMLEINANPIRLDLNDLLAARARELKIPLVINTDAHSTKALAVLRYGVLQARRGGLTKADVANTRTWKQFQQLLRRVK